MSNDEYIGESSSNKESIPFSRSIKESRITQYSEKLYEEQE